VFRPTESQGSFLVSIRQCLKKGRGNEARAHQEPFPEKGRLNWPYLESSLQEIFNSCLKITQLRIMAVFLLVKDSVLYSQLQNCSSREHLSIIGNKRHSHLHFLLKSLGKKKSSFFEKSYRWNTITCTCLCLDQVILVQWQLKKIYILREYSVVTSSCFPQISTLDMH